MYVDGEDEVKFHCFGGCNMNWDIYDALRDASAFYNKMLISNEDQFNKVHKYLHRRGVDTDLIQKFNIGFAPTLKDEKYYGRALIKKYLKRFEADYTTGMYRIVVCHGPSYSK